MYVWQKFLDDLEREIGKKTVDKWLRPLKIVKFDALNLYLSAKDAFQLDWFEEHIRPKTKNLRTNHDRPLQIHLTLEQKKEVKIEAAPFVIASQPLNPEMTEEKFYLVDQNAIAYRTIFSPEYNPIFLYGEKGSGKTHLLHLAAKKLEEEGRKIFFVSAETFTEHVVTAIRQSFMQEFRKVYRDIDALFVDDVHIFSRKWATQEEFFHTFNTLHMAGKRIFLSANVSPSHLKEIEPRLISRFEWGISLEMQKVDRSSLLKTKALQWNFPLQEELFSFLLESFSDPLLALQALILRKGKSDTPLILAKKLLADLLEKEGKEKLSPEKLIAKLAEHFSIQSEDILGKSQTREFALPRQIAMYLCRHTLKMSYPKIGEFFARDHSTVMTSVKRIEKGVEKKELPILEALRSFRV